MLVMLHHAAVHSYLVPVAVDDVLQLRRIDCSDDLVRKLVCNTCCCVYDMRCHQHLRPGVYANKWYNTAGLLHGQLLNLGSRAQCAKQCNSSSYKDSMHGN